MTCIHDYHCQGIDLFSVFKEDNVQVVVDEISLPLISGAKLVWEEKLIGSAFRVVDNPLVGTGCGCGTSFDINKRL